MIRSVFRYFGLGAAWFCSSANADASAAIGHGRVHSLKITILSTPLTNSTGIGEWGFSALVEADGHRMLYDTGQGPDTVLKNARTLKVDISNVPDAILSHNHADHIGGLVTLREAATATVTAGLGRTHVGDGIFSVEIPALKIVRGQNAAILLKPAYEKTGGVFVLHDRPVELYPGVWLTGPVPRNDEPCGGMNPKIMPPPGWDIIPEDMALICDTDRGLVVVTGCGHAGVINMIAFAQTFIRPARVHALIGGSHLNDATKETVSWTAEKLKSFGLENLLGAHCTDLKTVERFRGEIGLDRAHAVVAVVGSTFELGRGIDPHTGTK